MLGEEGSLSSVASQEYSVSHQGHFFVYTQGAFFPALRPQRCDFVVLVQLGDYSVTPQNSFLAGAQCAALRRLFRAAFAAVACCVYSAAPPSVAMLVSASCPSAKQLFKSKRGRLRGRRRPLWAPLLYVNCSARQPRRERPPTPVPRRGRYRWRTPDTPPRRAPTGRARGLRSRR